MPRTYYATAADVLRKFDPTLSVTDLDNNEFIGHDDLELVNAAIEDAEDEFEDLTRNPYRLVRQGNPGRPASYEQHEVDFRRYQGGVKFYLDNQPVVPFDPAEGDTLEIRIGRNSWKDITGDEGQFWEAHYPDGWIRIYGVHRYRTAWRRAALDRNVRVSYRYGAIGGDRNEAGQTTLSAQAAAGATTLEVADAGRLPRQGVLLIGSDDGGTNDEYVRFNDRDLSNDQLTGVTRGRRGTKDQQHASGTTVHYCPVSIRSAVAAQAAIELLQYDDWVAQLTESDAGVDASSKKDGWNSTWEKQLSKHSEARLL